LKCIAATGNGIEHEVKYVGFTEEDVHEASNTLHDRLQVKMAEEQNIYRKMTVRMEKCVILKSLKLAKYWIPSVK
jgi:hypothetical protein